SPSTFWVINVKYCFWHSSSTSALCPALGRALAIACRRQSYHSHTRRGSRRKASDVASSSGLHCFQSPSSPRNVGTPLSAEMPAPVRTAIFEALLIHSRACSTGLL